MFTIQFPKLPGARCAGDTDPELWFPLDEDKHGAAPKAICGRCPVQAECLAWAIEAAVPLGIWGGQTTAERLKRRPARPIRPVTPRPAPVARPGRPPARREVCPVCVTRQSVRSDGSMGIHSRGEERCGGVDERVTEALAGQAR